MACSATAPGDGIDDDVAGGQGFLQPSDLEVWVGGGGVAGAEDDVVAGLLPAGAERLRDASGAEDGDLHGCFLPCGGSGEEWSASGSPGRTAKSMLVRPAAARAT
jgi:hypothetical protein